MTNHCPFCGNQGMTSKQVAYLYRGNNGFMIVNAVPCLECNFCGEQYFESAVLKTIEKNFFAIQNSDKKPLRMIQVPMEDYAML